MIMPKGERLLLPVNPVFIWTTLLLFNFLTSAFNMWIFGRAAWAPDFFAVALVFWTVYQNRRVSIGAAFIFGLLVDGDTTCVVFLFLKCKTTKAWCDGV